MSGRGRPGPPLAVFDLDRTLLEGRTVLSLAERFGVLPKIQAIWDHHRRQELAAGAEESRTVARLFAGVPARDFWAACRGHRFRDGAAEAVASLRRLGFRIGVVSASYEPAVRDVRDRLGLDFHVGVRPLVGDGFLTGGIEPPAHEGPCRQYVCKAAVLQAESLRMRARFTMAVGDGANDVCLLEAADLGVAVRPCHPRLEAIAEAVIDDLAELPALASRTMGTAAPRRAGRTPDRP